MVLVIGYEKYSIHIFVSYTKHLLGHTMLSDTKSKIDIPVLYRANTFLAIIYGTAAQKVQVHSINAIWTLYLKA